MAISLGVLAALFLVSEKASASGCNLYSTSASCVWNGGVYNVVGPQPTGTGVIDSFLRVQENQAEEGFNTGARPMLCDGRTCDDKTDPNYTRDLQTSEVPVVNINATNYREFFLDINQTASTPGNLLTLDQVEIYVSDTPDLSAHTSGSPGYGAISGGATKVYDMETGNQDNWVNLNYTLIGGGSGSGDMVLYVPDSAAFANSQYVYLYSEFGCGANFTASAACGNGANQKYQSNAGFEEWWVPGLTVG